MTLDLSQLLLFAGSLLLTGCVSGFMAGLLGVGGGIIVVPILYMLFPALDVPEEVRMHLAVGTSLATIIPTAITSARAHYAKGGLDPKLLRAIAPSILVGVVAGSIFGGKASGTTLILIFAIIALLVSIYMAFRRDSWVLAPALPASPKFVFEASGTQNNNTDNCRTIWFSMEYDRTPNMGGAPTINVYTWDKPNDALLQLTNTSIAGSGVVWDTENDLRILGTGGAGTFKTIVPGSAKSRKLLAATDQCGILSTT